ncbi:MAG: ribosome biogenesis GTPase YlqF [Eubacteriales bacterium]|nr:ribosome biogenesis GTPase YlqF [Eubacteriales bacterium]
MEIQWYPGHMAKARRIMQESLKAVDLIIEIVDARIAYSSRNPDFNDLFAGKARVMVLNKADLADRTATRQWLEHFKGQGLSAVAFDSAHPKEKQQVSAIIERSAKEKVDRMAKRGARKVVRAMVAGIPNVGKSTFINAFAGSAAARTGNRPGVTRGKQIIRITPFLELLDTPGVLWPKLDDAQGALHLALTGAVKDEIMDTYRLSRELIAILAQRYPRALPERYKLAGLGETPDHTLMDIAGKRGFLLKGGDVDIERAAVTVLDEFRSAKLGQITLEVPGDIEERQDDPFMEL